MRPHDPTYIADASSVAVILNLLLRMDQFAIDEYVNSQPPLLTTLRPHTSSAVEKDPDTPEVALMRQLLEILLENEYEGEKREMCNSNINCMVNDPSKLMACVLHCIIRTLQLIFPKYIKQICDAPDISKAVKNKRLDALSKLIVNRCSSNADLDSFSFGIITDTSGGVDPKPSRGSLDDKKFKVMLLYSREHMPATATKPASTKYGTGDPPGSIGFIKQLTSFVTEVVALITGSDNEDDAIRVASRPINRSDADGNILPNTFIDLTNFLVKYSVFMAKLCRLYVSDTDKTIYIFTTAEINELQIEAIELRNLFVYIFSMNEMIKSPYWHLRRRHGNIAKFSQESYEHYQAVSGRMEKQMTSHGAFASISYELTIHCFICYDGREVELYHLVDKLMQANKYERAEHMWQQKHNVLMLDADAVAPPPAIEEDWGEENEAEVGYEAEENDVEEDLARLIL